jgi:hypothetical protein
MKIITKNIIQKKMNKIGLTVFQAITWVMESPRCLNLLKGFLWVAVLYVILKTVI